VIKLIICSAIVFAIVIGIGAQQSAAITPGPPSAPPDMACSKFEGQSKQQCLSIDLQIRRAEADDWIATSKYDANVADLDLTIGRAQLQRAPIILTIVVVVVSIGLLLSLLQFLRSYRTHELASKMPEATSQTASVDTADIKLSLQGLEVKTATIGLAILAMSLGFFYLYLTIVYTIHQS
jgi:hypothetical protein